MAYTEKEIITWSVTEDRHIQVLKTTVIFKDGEEIARTNHRHVLSPGDDLTAQDQEVTAAAQVLWTTAVIDAWNIKAEEPME